MATQFDIHWIDSGKEPQCPSDPKYPHGIDVDYRQGKQPACTVWLPYPALRCGYYVIHCHLCDKTVALTTAGRADDPRSLVMPCDLIQN